MKFTIKSVLVIIFIAITLTGCSNQDRTEKTIEEKSKQELEYIEDSIFNITNKYAKEEYIKDNTLDWNSILEDEKKINNILETIILDLTELNIEESEILKFSDELNNLLLVTASENEDELLARLNNLYALIPQYFEKFGNDKNDLQDKQLKSTVLASYSIANAENWEEAKTTIQSAIDKYNGMMNDVEYMQENSYRLNKIYILLGEVKNAIDTENIELTKLKFVNFIEKF